jgi:uncharacterized membrane protein
MHFIDILAIVVVGLMVGNELTVSLFINPVMWKLDAAAQLKALGLFARILGRTMPFWYGICLVLLLVEAVVRRHQAALWYLLTAVAIWAAIIVFTLVILLPINNRIAALAPDTPLGQWLPSHKQWDKLHRIRIAFLLAALLLLVHGLLGTA